MEFNGRVQRVCVRQEFREKSVNFRGQMKRLWCLR